MSENTKEAVLTIVIIAFVLLGLFTFLKQSADCSSRGGMYVKKMNGLMECVEEGKH